MADGSNISQLVTVNQNGVIALGNLANVVQALNTSILNRFGVLVPAPANATAAGVTNTFAINGTALFFCYAQNSWAKVLGTTSF